MNLTQTQLDAVQALGHPGTRGKILALPAGAGKTATVLRTIEKHWTLDPVVVIAPNNVAGQWPAEAVKWTGFGMVDLRGSKAKRLDNLAYAGEHGLDVVINYESAKLHVPELKQHVMGGTLVVDEAHYLKNHNSLAFKKIAQIARAADRVILVTGTPILNHPEELWTLLHLCDPKQFPSYWRWVRSRMSTKVTDFNGSLPRPIEQITAVTHPEEIVADLSQFLVGGYRRNEQNPHIVCEFIDLSPEERTAYDQLYRSNWVVIRQEFTQTVNKVANITRTRQLASDWSALSEHVGVGSKVQYALDLIRLFHDEKVVVFTAFKSTAEALASRLDSVALFTGDQTVAQRQKALRDFQDPNGPRVLIGTFGVLTEGVDGLQHVCRRAIFLDRDWTPARNEQAVARLARKGQAKPVYVHELIAADTIDEEMTAVLTSKHDLITEIMDSVPTRESV